ncbi:hypothetical protein lerEdw1_004667 [Lerista edwardsae]|nr:hypothetical protein lerEdw1_004667 [Lerista edwardsae]
MLVRRNQDSPTREAGGGRSGSVDVSLLVPPISLLLSEPCCQRARKLCHDLNYIFDLPVGPSVQWARSEGCVLESPGGLRLDVLLRLWFSSSPRQAPATSPLFAGPSPFPPGCTSVIQRHKPLIGSQGIEFRCSTVVNCGGTEYHFGTNPNLALPTPRTADGITHYFTLKDWNDFFTLCRIQHLFDTSITLGSFPGNLPVVLKITCTDISVALTPDRATLHCNFWIEVGCEGFPLLLRLNLLPELGVLLGLPSLITGWIKAQLLIGFPWVTFNTYGCGTCSDVLWIQDICFWSCSMKYPVL